MHSLLMRNYANSFVSIVLAYQDRYRIRQNNASIRLNYNELEFLNKENVLKQHFICENGCVLKCLLCETVLVVHLMACNTCIYHPCELQLEEKCEETNLYC